MRTLLEKIGMKMLPNTPQLHAGPRPRIMMYHHKPPTRVGLFSSCWLISEETGFSAGKQTGSNVFVAAQSANKNYNPVIEFYAIDWVLWSGGAVIVVGIKVQRFHAGAHIICLDPVPSVARKRAFRRLIDVSRFQN